MKNWLREYGLISLVIIVAMVGYVIYRQDRQDILATSLDVLRDRLVMIIDDAASRQVVAAHFDQFKQRVLSQEVTPEEVENVAANVLNFSNSGMTITPEQATMMLDLASDVPEVTLLPVSGEEASDDTLEASPPPAVAPTPTVRPAPSPRPAAAPVKPNDLNALGERLETVLAFDAQAQKAMDGRRGQPEMGQHIRYRLERGLHVVLDEEMTPEMKRRLAREAQKLTERRMAVVWKRNMAEEMRAERERARRELQSVTALQKRPPREVRVAVHNLKALETLKHLEMMGYQSMLADSVRREIKVHLEVALEALEKDLERAMEADGAAVEAQMESLEGFLEEVEKSLEALEEEVEEANGVNEEA